MTGTLSDYRASGVASAGAAIVYQYESNNWIEKQVISACNPTELDCFGYSAGISNSTIVAGAPFEDSNSSGVFLADFGSGADNDTGENAGAAYIYYYNDIIFANGFE